MNFPDDRMEIAGLYALVAGAVMFFVFIAAVIIVSFS